MIFSRQFLFYSELCAFLAPCHKVGVKSHFEGNGAFTQTRRGRASLLTTAIHNSLFLPPLTGGSTHWWHQTGGNNGKKWQLEGSKPPPPWEPCSKTGKWAQSIYAFMENTVTDTSTKSRTLSIKPTNKFAEQFQNASALLL